MYVTYVLRMRNVCSLLVCGWSVFVRPRFSALNWDSECSLVFYVRIILNCRVRSWIARTQQSYVQSTVITSVISLVITIVIYLRYLWFDCIKLSLSNPIHITLATLSRGFKCLCSYCFINAKHSQLCNSYVHCNCAACICDNHYWIVC